MRYKPSTSQMTRIIISVAIVVPLAYYFSRPGYITVTPSPSDSKILISGKAVLANKKTKLSQGYQTITIERSGFKTQTTTVKVSPGKELKLAASLEVNIAYISQGNKLNLPAADTAVSQGASGQLLAYKIAQAETDNPLIKLLPYITSNFRVDYGASQKDPNSITQAIYITAGTTQAKQAALQWIQGKGGDTSKMEIIYLQPGSEDQGWL